MVIWSLIPIIDPPASNIEIKIETFSSRLPSKLRTLGSLVKLLKAKKPFKSIISLQIISIQLLIITNQIGIKSKNSFNHLSIPLQKTQNLIHYSIFLIKSSFINNSSRSFQRDSMLINSISIIKTLVNTYIINKHSNLNNLSRIFCLKMCACKASLSSLT